VQLVVISVVHWMGVHTCLSLSNIISNMSSLFVVSDRLWHWLSVFCPVFDSRLKQCRWLSRMGSCSLSNPSLHCPHVVALLHELHPGVSSVHSCPRRMHVFWPDTKLCV